MAKMRQTINGATLDVEGDEASIATACRGFHRLLAEQALRSVDERLAAMRELQKQRRELKKLIAGLES